MKKPDCDVVIVGGGPNGLSAGIYLTSLGLDVQIFERKNRLGGGTLSEELTLPGFLHDFCSAVHPMGFLSPYLSSLNLEEYGLEWIFPKYSVAHPMVNEDAVILSTSIEETMKSIGSDGQRWKRLFSDFVTRKEELFIDVFSPPFDFPKSPLLFGKFGFLGFSSALFFARTFFKKPRARALFGGLAAHSVLPLNQVLTAAVGLLFGISGHACSWPIVKGGSQNLSLAMSRKFASQGGKVFLNQHIDDYKQLPTAKKYMFDLDPLQVANICKDLFPESYAGQLKKYHFGPGVFKVDFALNQSIPWKDKKCIDASTVHVGGTIEEINKSETAVWKGRHTEKPFVMVCQQSELDQTRSPKNQHTGYAYCHVPNSSEKDYTTIIENQIERFAPGFKDIILDKRSTNTHDFYKYNPNYFGGAITGGAANIKQFFFRPTVSLKPYTTAHEDIYICSASTPPGGGVHGMSGYHAAKLVAKSLL